MWYVSGLAKVDNNQQLNVKRCANAKQNLRPPKATPPPPPPRPGLVRPPSDELGGGPSTLKLGAFA